MSYIARRGLSTLIPPKIASPNAIGAAQDAARMDRVVNFYARLPRGAAPETKGTGIIGRYQARYFNGKNASAAPLAHAIGGILIVGYSLEYYFHLHSGIVMAEQSSHDVVNQTLSGGEPLPSDVPASANVKNTAGGDVGETGYTTTNMSYDQSRNAHHHYGHANMQDQSYAGKDNGASATGPGSVASRALDMNGRTASSDGGEDTGSQGGSESDASRTDSRHPTRTGSLKKPGSFRPVSFTKISLPKAPGAPAAPKAPEKGPQSSTTPLGTPPQSSRPRLVAKSTSGLRDSLSKSGGNATKPGGGGPDPSQVWNRNRPAQPPPSKNLTDEELKQQYGIHMTSRIQEDGSATEGKWADIDDDEDDWAPETIEWTDGTKTNLADPPTPAPQPASLPTPPQPAPRQTILQEQQQQHQLHHHHHHQHHQQQQQPLYHQDAKYPGEQPREPLVQMEQPPAARETLRYVPKPTTSIGPNATVLRVGANAEKQAKYANMPRGPNDKQPFSASNHAPPPSKSPWAPLPPVEKASPAALPPAQLQQQQQQPPRPFNRADHQMGEVPPGGPVPSGFPPGGHPHPKEIAADDFNRSWRDMQTGAPRELFNSRSGRYEPVPEQPRKGPVRNEQAYRGPSVLQRPVPGEQGGGPAEPSAAFQTHRSGGQDAAGPWTRRRASSNVSGGSGGFARRMSVGRPDAPHHAFDGRRESQVNGMVEQPPMPTGDFPPTKGQAPGPGGWQSRAAGNTNDSLPAPMGGPHQQAPTAPMAEPAPAPQTPQEDPVAMQERIMKEKRMEARQRRIEQEEKEEAAKRERIRQKLEALGPVPEKPKRKDSLDTDQPESATPTGTTAAAADTSQSPPKPPVPEPSGEPKQYGMMKVHHPSTVKKFVANDRERGGPEKSKQDAASVPNGPQEQQQPSEFQPQVTPKQPESQLDEQGSQWRNNANVPGSYSPWSPSNKFIRSPPSLTNPWKPLSNDRTLGNGIFDPSLGGFPAAKEVPLRGHLGLDQPSSIAPGANQPFPAASRSPQEPATTISPLPSPDVRNAVHDPLSPIGRPGPIGPPSSQHAPWPNEPRATGTAAWNNFHVVAAKREAEEAEKRRHELNALREVPSTLQVDFSETWRQVRTGDQAGQRQVVGITKPTEPQVNASNILPGLDPVGSLPSFPDSSPARPLGGVQPRSSRFFPQATEHVKKLNVEGEYDRSPSPPPPEEVSSHPVFTGNSTRPLVHLPAPKPVVKLPPRIIAEQQQLQQQQQQLQQQQQQQQQQPPQPPSAPPTFASMVATPPKNAPAASTATTWQEKINGLFGKKTVAEKRSALEVTSSSKEPLEEVPIPMAAAVSVSFPHKLGATVVDTVSDEITAKHFEDTEAIFEDREVGSQPVVRVPNMAPPNAWLAAPPPPPSQSRPKSKNPMQVRSIDPFFFGFDKEPTTGNIRISIRFPGTEIAKTLALPKKAAASPNPRYHKVGGGGGGSSANTANGGSGSGAGGASGFKPKKANAKQREGHGNVPPKKASQQSGGTNGSSQRNQPRNGSWSRPR